MTTDNQNTHRMADLATLVGQAIDDHANPRDESEKPLPGWQLDQTHDADLIERLKAGEGKAHEVKLHTDASGQHWAVQDWDAAMARMDSEPEPVSTPAPPADPDRPAYVRAPRQHGPAAIAAYGHISVQAGVRLFEALMQNEMARKENQA